MTERVLLFLRGSARHTFVTVDAGQVAALLGAAPGEVDAALLQLQVEGLLHAIPCHVGRDGAPLYRLAG